MPDQKKKWRPYSPRHFDPLPSDDSAVVFVIADNNAEFSKYHAGAEEDSPLINEFCPRECPRCGSTSTESKGRSAAGAQIRRCLSCGRSWTLSGNTLLSRHRLPLKALIRFLVNMLTWASVNEACKAAKISMKTGLYWLQKVFIALRGYQDGIELGGTVYLDDKFIDVEASGKAKSPRGSLMLGDNQWNVAIGKSGRARLLILQGKSKSSDRRLLKTWSGRIAKGSRLITDGDKAYGLLANKLELSWTRVKFVYRHGEQCPELQPINTLASNVERWFQIHCGITKTAERIQDYLNLLSFTLNAKGNALRKASELMKMLMKTKAVLRFRAINADKQDTSPP